MSSNVTYAAYVGVLLALWLLIGGGHWMRERSAALRLRQAIDSGASEPLSLHPIIDPARCVGCGACTHACPEGDVIGLIGGKAQLIDPVACIGHGACKTACPVGAIELVFGSAQRGVDIPLVTPEFESNVPGVFIAGELGGMGLIANAIEQGRQAINNIAQRGLANTPGVYDVVIVGGGPAGIAASLAAKEKHLRYLTLDQDTPGGAIVHYPRGKLVMTRPAELPLYGRLYLRSIRKERLLTLWQKIIRDSAIEIHSGVRVTHIARQPWGFDVSTSRGVCRARTVLLATGRRGAPRRLGVPGEQLSKVVYSLDDASQYNGRTVLVVGGGDSAIECAVELARYPIASIVLSYRGSAFNRVKPINRRRLDDAVRAGRLSIMTGSNVSSIEADRVTIDRAGNLHTLANDAVIICIGGLLPTSLLNEIGIRVETKYGAA